MDSCFGTVLKGKLSSLIFNCYNNEINCAVFFTIKDVALLLSCLPRKKKKKTPVILVLYCSLKEESTILGLDLYWRNISMDCMF
jgi:hypothetical protein